MPNTFEITIINESGSSQGYLLFCAQPQISSGSGSQVFQNVWMTAPPIVSNPQGKSSTTFVINQQFYGVCGTSVSNLSSGVIVSTNDYEEVDLGNGQTPGTLLNFTTIGGANFSSFSNKGPLNGGFTISGDSSWKLPDPNNTFIGLGGRDMRGRVVPVATLLAAPSTTYNIFPKVVYYISTGSAVEGEIVDITSFGNVQLVDFSSSTYNSQTFIHQNDGTYSPVSQLAAKAHKLRTLALEKVIQSRDIELASKTGGLSGCLVKEDLLAKKLQEAFLKLIHGLDLDA
ncbi:hypothetical protein EV127DRAFT_483512 [Xylaria flabelliformis]|nr:hypothetical protein EV127DRAFT_483512 [Xylaria flabelliformis]